MTQKKKAYKTFREFLKWLMQHKVTQRFVIALILLNAATLGMETSPSLMAKYGVTLHYVDHIILGLFVTELLFRIIACGPKRFFRDPWSLFDFVVVSIAFLPNGGELSVLRTLRILRVLRLISTVPSMRRVINGLIASLSGMISVAAILLIVYYLFAVIATHLFAGFSEEHFGTLGDSMFTLFQIMTLENWTEIARPVMKLYPYAWAFFVIFILTSTFTMLNLFVGVMVNTMGNLTHVEEEEYKGVDRRKRAAPSALTEMHIQQVEKKMLKEMSDLRKQLAELHMALKK